MAQVINTNIMSLNAQRNLNTNSASLATSIQRLSSGLRINSARDDAAGLAISERFSTQIRGLTVAARNANDGISLAQTTEGALNEIGNNLQRIRELAVQSRNATNSDSDRAALDAEVQQLKAEIQRVAEQTQFNGTNLLDGSFTGAVFQVGANQGQTISVDKLVDANIAKLGSWIAPVASGKVANAGTMGIKDGKAAGVIAFEINDVKVEIGEKTGRTADQALAELKTAFETAKKTHADLAKVSIGDDYKITSSEDLKINAGDTVSGLTGGEIAAVVPSVSTASAIAVTQGKGAENISIEINGVKVEIEAKEKRSDEDAKKELIAKFNDLKKTEAKLANVSIDSNDKITSTQNLKVGAVKGLDAAIKGELTVAAAGPDATGFAGETVKTAEAADRMILAMDAALNAVNSGRAALGAIQNRFSSVVANLNSTSENLSASRSRIRDADYAQETAELTRTQILQQAGTAMLAQAKAIPQGVLSLLQ